jgi:hypothetical protein
MIVMNWGEDGVRKEPGEPWNVRGKKSAYKRESGQLPPDLISNDAIGSCIAAKTNVFGNDCLVKVFKIFKLSSLYCRSKERLATKMTAWQLKIPMNV